MARYANPDEVRDEIIAAFPPDMGELFYELWTDASNLHLNWRNYLSLYGTSAERVDLLKCTANSFFRLLDQIMRHDVLLRIARLTDPASSCGRANASLAQLVEKVCTHLQADEAKGLSTKLEALCTCCERIRTLRNRVLAHDDLETALHYHTDPLPGISAAYIEGALERICSLLNDIEVRYRKATTLYEKVLSIGTGEEVISALERAKKHEECEKAEFKRKYGVPHPKQAD